MPRIVSTFIGRDASGQSVIHMHHDHEWNAGDMSCGDLVLALRQRMRQAPGQVLKLIALDAGAPADLPAWCRMTGNPLLAQDPETHAYWIRAKP